MHKLVILIEPPDDWAAFDDTWPQFLHHAEGMPGLLREATSRVDAFIYGERTYALMHELFFDTLEQAREAMVSAEGRQAGQVLQTLSRGRMALFFADHKEDDLENIRRLKVPASRLGCPRQDRLPAAPALPGEEASEAAGEEASEGRLES
jgi:hypothetical protein